ncbi:hypothetical protein ACRQ5Q_15030 [Bradyrhizobium sp. PMVTL-01]|uniref:hypothetical protein n=1 Tax=Bradyrhizobium sp. PMVTL-01 TaxID=3434999 RepID=UPI003F70841F
MTDVEQAGAQARLIIATEVAKQNAMWGDANDRADILKGQLLGAASAQLMAVWSANFEPQISRETAFEIARESVFPKDWGGFRDYGSDIANLAVVGAYIENEIKRRLLNGESTYRKPRDLVTQPFDGSCVPNPGA